MSAPTIRSIIGGLEILAKYAKPAPGIQYPESDQALLSGAANGILLGPALDREPDDDDADALESFGWSYSEHYTMWVRFI